MFTLGDFNVSLSLYTWVPNDVKEYFGFCTVFVLKQRLHLSLY